MSSKPIFFANSKALRAWFDANAESAAELIVGFYKVGSGKASITWPESVDEALCVGWIDGIRRRIDDESYQIRFTPRRPGSVWSAVNVKRAEALIAERRMKPRGLKAFQQRTENKTGIYSYEKTGSLALTIDELAAFKMNAAAWSYFEHAPAGYRKTMIYWIASAKREATRERRLRKLIESCAAGTRLLP
jgi:uncharacterized protein YdeI (YjbR/CyaY-like superfamily)